MEQKIVTYEELLKKKESEHRAHIHNLERKMLQDKVCVIKVANLVPLESNQERNDSKSE